MYTNRKDFPTILPETNVMYCWSCKATTVEKISGEKVVFKCLTCNALNERVLIFDPAMWQTFDEEQNLVHYSAGVMLFNEKNELLIFLRRKFPYLYTIPAGHISVNEDPKKAGIRELQEEVDVHINHAELIFQGKIYNESCLGGADIHYWYLYKAKITQKEIILDEEGSEWKWIALDHIDVDTVISPLKFFLISKEILEKLK